jgi:hypothetical protein
MWLDGYDGSTRFDLMGPYAIPDYTTPECVQVKKDGLKGLVAPWKHIDQKGATQDGVSQLDALYDPIEIQLDVMCRGRDGKYTRQVTRDLIASIDAKQQSKLNFLQADTGEHWWAPIRWFQGAPPNPVVGAQQRRQPLSLRLRGDNAFWRTYSDTAVFGFIYESMVDNFTIDYSGTQNLGPNWPQYYTGPGAGYCSNIVSSFFGFPVDMARWYPSGDGQREVVNGPYKNFSTDTDNQVVSMVLGSFPEFTFVGEAFNDLWGRMGRNGDGTWDGNGIRARIGLEGIFGWVELSRFNNFVKTVMYSSIMFIPPLPFETFTLVCGVDNGDGTSDPRMFRIMRDGIPIVSHKEIGTASNVGSAYRGVGFGMEVGSTLFLGQKVPAWISKISAGDNAQVSQSGWLQRTNVGDQPMYDDYVFIGPGTVRIWDGPATDQHVEFGPLLANQVAFLRTDPRDRNVYDLSTIASSPNRTQKPIFQASLDGLTSFGTANNFNPILAEIQSVFHIFSNAPTPVPPQGNFYSLLNGRFSDASAIPPKSPGNPVQPYHVKVEIVGGNADSKIIASGIPLRRYPL